MIKALKQFFSEFTYFSAPARKVMWVLIVLIFVIAIAPSIYSKFVPNTTINPTPQQIEEYNNLLASIENSKIQKYHIPDSSFDPNKLNTIQWLSIGLNTDIAKRIEKFIAKGGSFKKHEDVLKIYGLDTLLYEQLVAKMYFSDNKTGLRKHFEKPIKKSLPIIDINTADSAQWESLSGIGPSIASRIVKYKNLLGGFYSENQLLEVYGINNELYLKIRKYIICSKCSLIKLKINTATYIQLAKHPYIGKDKTKLILKLRKEKEIKELDSLMLTKIFTETEFKKLQPYIEL